MVRPSKLTAVLWWGTYTIIGVWAQRVFPGVDFLAPGIVLSMQEEGAAVLFGSLSFGFYCSKAWGISRSGMV